MNDLKLNNTKDRLKKSLKSMNCHKLDNAFLFNADCFDILRELPDNSIDSAVLDGPYGISHLGHAWDSFNPKKIRKGIKRKDGAGISPSMYSGKYDTSKKGAVKFQIFSYQWAVEMLRVLKPGSHLISFCSPRMYHRMATGIEDAGFEIRDQIQFLFGTGMPKSHNISKAIDKLAGAEREIVGENPNRKGRRNWDSNPKNISLPATEESRYWNGWGTALKPSNEPIVLARKPISEKSIARNILLHGIGGININACRIGEEGGTKALVRLKDNENRRLFNGGISNDVEIKSINKGRFPSNTIINDEVAELLGDKAKFFYSAKVSSKERNAGCEHLKSKVQNSKGKGRTYNDRCAICKKKFVGSEKTRCQCSPGVKKTDKSVYKNKNHHPTVKNLALMEYLVRLVTPIKGICLDIFMGSGSTGIACSNLGFDFIGIEREFQYFEIAKARISHWQNLKKVA